MTDWYCLGIHLEIATSYLDQIEKNYGSDGERCKIEVIDIWLCNDENPTWRKLVQAVENMAAHSITVQTLRANHEGS